MNSDVSVKFSWCAASDIEVSDSDIIPQNYQNKLMYWRDRLKEGYFQIGDIAAELLERSAQQGFPITQVRVFAAVGKFCDRSGRTVRYYYEVASFYPPDVRDQYDVLSFSAFAFAKSMGHRWKEVLDYAMLYPSISEDGLRIHFLVSLPTPDDYAEPEPSPSIPTTLSPSIPPLIPTSHAQTSVARNAVKSHAITTLGSLVDSLGEVLRSVPIRTESRDRLAEALDTIREILPEIWQAIGIK